jgi:carbon-monoxide dehydrogenase large subunit
VFFGEGTGGSRSATLAGSAFHMATEKIVTKARTIAAHMLKVDEPDLQFEEGVFSTNKTNRTLTIKELAVASLEPANLADGMEPGLSATAIYSAPLANYPNGCHVCEVEIDRDTGKVDILRYSVVDDVGTVMNDKLLHGQIQGGIAQGAGQALMEDIHFDAAGQLVTASFMDYAMPRAHDFCAMEVDSNPVPTRTNPLGVKGAGEAGCVGALPAVINALVDALAEFGVKHIEMPATPERIWRAINGR